MRKETVSPQVQKPLIDTSEMNVSQPPPPPLDNAVDNDAGNGMEVLAENPSSGEQEQEKEQDAAEGTDLSQNLLEMSSQETQQSPPKRSGLCSLSPVNYKVNNWTGQRNKRAQSKNNAQTKDDAKEKPANKTKAVKSPQEEKGDKKKEGETKSNSKEKLPKKTNKKSDKKSNKEEEKKSDKNKEKNTGKKNIKEIEYPSKVP